MKMLTLFLGSLFFAVATYAEDPERCPYFVERQEGTQIQQLWSDGSQSCFFSITPLDAYVDLVYRDHLFTTEGLFMVFNSYGQGPESQTTASREFFLFPRIQDRFSHKWDPVRKELELTHVTGDKFVFDSRKARLKSMTRAQVFVANDVEPSNRGGIEIKNFEGLLLDGGFLIGNAPTTNPNAKSSIKDGKGQACSFYNKEVFKYTTDGDVIFKYSDKDFFNFLKKRCPNITP